MPRKICVITGSRAEYGLMKPLIQALHNHRHVHLQIVVTGAHLSRDFGLTYREIIKDGFTIDAKVPSLVIEGGDIAVSASMGQGMTGMAKAYSRLKPDLIIGMGDRYEMFAAFAAAMVAGIPIAHFSGGELTEGAYDDAIRHAMTKMSHLHFTSTEEYRKRVIQLGEQPKRVFNVGEIGLCDVKSMTLLSDQQLEQQLGFRFADHNYLITFHPETLSAKKTEQNLKELLKALDAVKNSLFIFTKSNADTGGVNFNKIIAKFVKQRPGLAVFFDSLGRLRYLSMFKYIDAVVGNSSSGLVEAPSFAVPTINIGSRQEGRAKADSVIDCLPTKDEIFKAIKYAAGKSFQMKLRSVRNPYGDGKSIGKVMDVLVHVSLEGLTYKKFHDVRV